MEANTQSLRALISQGTDIYIFLKTAPFYQFNCYLAKLINSIRQVNLQHPAAVV
ncbi:hypothetical protein ES703_119883 [subsurface metagenome]